MSSFSYWGSPLSFSSSINYVWEEMTVAPLGDQDLGENPKNISAGVTSQCCSIQASIWTPYSFPVGVSLLCLSHTALATAGAYPLTLMPPWSEEVTSLGIRILSSILKLPGCWVSSVLTVTVQHCSLPLPCNLLLSCPEFGKLCSGGRPGELWGPLSGTT